MEQSLFTIEELCSRWNISRSTLDRWRKEKEEFIEPTNKSNSNTN